MAEQQPWLLQECFTATGARLFTNNLVCGEGVADVLGGSLLVTTGGSGLNLSVAEGGGFVDSDVDDQGMYSIFNDGPVTVTADAADGTNPRIDQVIATVDDSQQAGPDDDWVLSVLPGTPTGGANLTNLNGAATLPDRTIRLAYILVPASFAGPFVNATHILDARTPYVLCGEPNVPSTQWRRTTNQSTSSGVEQAFTYSSHSGTTVPNAFYSETGGVHTFHVSGLYHVVTQISWEPNAAGYRKVRLYVNGAEAGQVALPETGAGEGCVQRLPAILDIDPGDELQVKVQQNAGSIDMTEATIRITRLGTLA